MKMTGIADAAPLGQSAPRSIHHLILAATRMLARLFLVAAFALGLLSLVGPARTHPPAILNEAAERAVADEVKAFRKALADAIAAKDVARLKAMYAASFTHTHTSAKSDNRDARIVAALAGEPVIETAPVDDLVIRVPNDWVAIATGTSPIKAMSDGKLYAVRWMAVYTRSELGWVLAASQATRSHEIKP